MSKIQPLITTPVAPRAQRFTPRAEPLGKVTHTVITADGRCEMVVTNGDSQQRSVVSEPDPAKPKQDTSVFELSARQANAAAQAALAAQSAQANATASSDAMAASQQARTSLAVGGDTLDVDDALGAVASTDAAGSTSSQAESSPVENPPSQDASELGTLYETLLRHLQDNMEAQATQESQTSVEFVPSLPLFENTTFQLRGEADALRLDCRSNSAAEQSWLETHREALGTRLSQGLGRAVIVAVAAPH